MWVYIHVCIYKDRWRNETQYASLKTTDCSACRGIKLSKSLIPAVDSKHCGENWPQFWSPGSADGACKKGLETALCEEGAGCHSPAGMTAQPRHTEEAVRWGRNFSAAKISFPGSRAALQQVTSRRDSFPAAWTKPQGNCREPGRDSLNAPCRKAASCQRAAWPDTRKGEQSWALSTK